MATEVPGEYLRLLPLPFIAILRGLEAKQAIEVGSLLLKEGFTILEVPLNRPGALETIRVLSEAFGKEALVGAGTVLCQNDVDAVVSAGGKLIVSPDTNSKVIQAARKAGLWSIPGAATPTEAFIALRSGAHALKLFPGEIIGPGGLKALKAVLPPSVPLIPVGGVSRENLGQWLAAGAAGFGIGSALFNPNYSLREIADRAAALRITYEAAGAGS